MDGATSSDFSVLPKSSCPINGMVERFNRRLGEHLDRLPQNRAAHHRPFLNHAERDVYLYTFMAD